MLSSTDAVVLSSFASRDRERAGTALSRSRLATGAGAAQNRWRYHHRVRASGSVVPDTYEQVPAALLVRQSLPPGRRHAVDGRSLPRRGEKGKRDVSEFLGIKKTPFPLSSQMKCIRFEQQSLCLSLLSFEEDQPASVGGHKTTAATNSPPKA